MRTLGLVAAVWAIGFASAGTADGGQAQQTYSGEADFQTYCSVCHGAGAKGDGVLASTFRKRPADLTKLAQRNNGTFSSEDVFKTIDGRKPPSGHGGPDMPAWNELFAKAQESAGPAAAKARIEALVRYLETLQEKEKR